MSRATLALPGSLALGSELSQQRSEVLSSLAKQALPVDVD